MSAPKPIGNAPLIDTNDLLDADTVPPTKSNPWFKASWILGGIGLSLGLLGVGAILAATFPPVTLSLATMGIILLVGKGLAAAGALTLIAGVVTGIIGCCRKDEAPTKPIIPPALGPVYNGT